MASGAWAVAIQSRAATRERARRQGGQPMSEPAMRATGIALVFAVLSTAPAAGQEARPTLEKIKATGAIALGYRETSSPFSCAARHKKPAGSSVDLCLRAATAIQHRLGMKELAVNWAPVTPSSRIGELIRGGIDLECGSTTITFSRMEQVDFTFLTFVDGASLLATT